MNWQARTAEDTEAFGGRLADARWPANTLSPDAPLAPDVPTRAGPLSVVYLEGDLGAGKTTLARGFLRACGVTGPVRSPTYTLLEVYETPRVTVLHLDLYRLLDPSELETLGLREWAREGHTWLVEWPDRGAGWLPPADLVIGLNAGTQGHDITALAGSPAGAVWLRRLIAVEKPPGQP